MKAVRSRKTAHLELGLLLGVATLFGCGSRSQSVERRCADQDGGFVEDGLCEHSGGTSGSWDGDGGSPVTPRPGYSGYHYVYVTRTGGSFWGGGGHASTGATGVSRGGFGATGAAHASGAGA